MTTQAQRSQKGKRQTRRLRLFISTVAVFLALFASWFWVSGSNVDDPIYDGRRLSSWLSGYPHTAVQPLTAPTTGETTHVMSEDEVNHFYRKSFGDEVAEAHEALLHLRERAFPFLLRVLGEPEEAPTKIGIWSAGIRKQLVQFGLVQPNGYHVPREQAVTALLDLQRGGCDLAPVVSKIEQMTTNSNNTVSETARFLIESLTRQRVLLSAREGAEPSASPEPPPRVSDLGGQD